jgi:hypothetical protein
MALIHLWACQCVGMGFQRKTQTTKSWEGIVSSVFFEVMLFCHCRRKFLFKLSEVSSIIQIFLFYFAGP